MREIPYSDKFQNEQQYFEKTIVTFIGIFYYY